MSLDSSIRQMLKECGADLIRFVDVSELPVELTGGYPSAILIAMVLSPGYIRKIIRTPDYVERMIREKTVHLDEFDLKERSTDDLADRTSAYLEARGYRALSQSEENLASAGLYYAERKTTRLPHKTIALMAGLGWIGKHDLLVSPEFGSAISMCSVLTDAPVTGELHQPMESGCGDCSVCRTVCLPGAITGREWSRNTSRNELIKVERCTTCLRCMAMCPFTVEYAENRSG